MIEHDPSTQNLGDRSVTLTRDTQGHFTVTNNRGGTMTVGTGDDESFTPVELFLAAISCCSAIDVDFLTTKRTEPERFSAVAHGDKMKSDVYGNFMDQLRVVFDVAFPDTAEGKRSTEFLPTAIEKSQNRLCTVSRTVAGGVPVSFSTAATNTADEDPR